MSATKTLRHKVVKFDPVFLRLSAFVAIFFEAPKINQNKGLYISCGYLFKSTIFFNVGLI